MGTGASKGKPGVGEAKIVTEQNIVMRPPQKTDLKSTVHTPDIDIWKKEKRREQRQDVYRDILLSVLGCSAYIMKTPPGFLEILHANQKKKSIHRRHKNISNNLTQHEIQMNMKRHE